MDSALTSNLDLAATWQQVLASRALVRSESSFLWPQIEASMGAEIQGPDGRFSEGEDLYGALAASYELDLWGRIRAGVQAEEFRSQATFYDYQATALLLSAEIGNIWFQLLTLRHQLALAREQLRVNEDILSLIRSRFTGGQVRAVDILRQEQLLESTRSQEIFYETQLQLVRNQLAVLLGQPPQNPLTVAGVELEKMLKLQTAEAIDLPVLPELPPLPDTGLPLELIRRRPDVQQAHALVLAADREMASAIASKYPRLSVYADAETFANNASSLFRDWAYTLGSNLVAPLLYGGRLQAQVDIAEAGKDQQLYLYGQTVLTAFREVEDALFQEAQQKERLEVLKKQLELSRKTNEQLRREYLNGMSEYLEVLLSLDEQQQLQRDLLEAQLQLLEIRISLYRALAGGFGTVYESG